MKRKRHTSTEIMAMLAAYRRSGLSVTKFAEEQGVAVGTIYNWLSRARKKPDIVKIAAPIPAAATGESASCSFRWSDGRALQFPADISECQLAGIIRALRSTK